MSTSTFRGHRPTGQTSWPMVVVAGPEKTGKSYLAAEFSGSDLIGETFWIEFGETSAEEYGAVPGARYLIGEHDGTFTDVCRRAREAVAEPMRDGKPNLIVIDSVSVIWETLSAEAQLIANRRKKADIDAESKVTADLWNIAKDRWKKLIRILKQHNGPVVLVARLEVVAVMDAAGQPTKDKVKKVVGHKSLGYDVSAIVQIPKYRQFELTGVRSLHLQMPPEETFPLPPDFTLDALMRNLGLDEPGAAGPRVFVEPVADADDALADAGGAPPVVTDPNWLASVRADIAAAPNLDALNAIGGRIGTEAATGRLAATDGEALRELFDARTAALRVQATQTEDARTTPAGPPPVGSPDNPAAPPALLRMIIATGARQQHGVASLIDLARRALGREITALEQLSRTEGEAFLRTLTTGEVPTHTPVVKTNSTGDLLASKNQLANLTMEFANHGITDRTVRLAHTSQLLSRPITSSVELTVEEYRQVRKALIEGWPHTEPVAGQVRGGPADIGEGIGLMDVLTQIIDDAHTAEEFEQARADIEREHAEGTIGGDQLAALQARWIDARNHAQQMAGAAA